MVIGKYPDTTAHKNGAIPIRRVSKRDKSSCLGYQWNDFLLIFLFLSSAKKDHQIYITPCIKEPQPSYPKP